MQAREIKAKHKSNKIWIKELPLSSCFWLWPCNYTITNINRQRTKSNQTLEYGDVDSCFPQENINLTLFLVSYIQCSQAIENISIGRFHLDNTSLPKQCIPMSLKLFKNFLAIRLSLFRQGRESSLHGKLQLLASTRLVNCLTKTKRQKHWCTGC